MQGKKEKAPCDLGQLILDEFDLINIANQEYASKKIYTTFDTACPALLASALNVSDQRVYAILYLDSDGNPRKFTDIHTVMRIIAVLAPSEERAFEMIHAAGFNIDQPYPRYDIYREIIKNASTLSVDKINELLKKTGSKKEIFKKINRV